MEEIPLSKRCVLRAIDDNERKPYFEPREAKPDHPLMKRAAPGVVAVNQVAAPDVQNELDNPEVSTAYL